MIPFDMNGKIPNFYRRNSNLKTIKMKFYQSSYNHPTCYSISRVRVCTVVCTVRVPVFEIKIIFIG